MRSASLHVHTFYEHRTDADEANWVMPVDEYRGRATITPYLWWIFNFYNRQNMPNTRLDSIWLSTNRQMQNYAPFFCVGCTFNGRFSESRVVPQQSKERKNGVTVFFGAWEWHIWIMILGWASDDDRILKLELTSWQNSAWDWSDVKSLINYFIWGIKLPLMEIDFIVQRFVCSGLKMNNTVSELKSLANKYEFHKQHIDFILRYMYVLRSIYRSKTG